MRESELSDSRAPRRRSSYGEVLRRVPERAVVHGVDREVAVVAPPGRGSRLAACAIEQMRLALSERVGGVDDEATRVADLRVDAAARCAESDGEVTLMIHRGASHPPPGRVGRIRAFLVDRDGSARHAAQLEPARRRDARGAYAEIPHHRLVIPEVAVCQAEHRTIADAVKLDGRAQLRNAASG